MTTFICKECAKKFDRKSELIQHKKVHRPPDEDSDSDDDEEPRYYKCPYDGCDERFQTRDELLRHKWVHREPAEEEEAVQNDAECDLCGEFFWYHDELITHRMNQHGAQGNSLYHQCPHVRCEFRSADKEELVKHKQVNHQQEAEEEEDIQCDMCHEWFTSEKKLKIHKMDDHNYNDNPTFGKLYYTL